MKKYLLFIFFLFMLFLNFNNVSVSALTVEEVLNRGLCDEMSFELAIASVDGSLVRKSCHASYEAAINAMNIDESLEKDLLVILETKNNETRIIDAKYAFVDMKKVVNNSTTNLFKFANDASPYTYIYASGTYGSQEAPFLGMDYNTSRARIAISGFFGYVDYIDAGYVAYNVIPLSWVKSTGYYVVDDKGVSHYYTSNMYGENNYPNGVSLGPKPDVIPNGTYYSYDGIYFYTDLKLMIDDYKADVRDNSINKEHPYYNYYMWLPQHSKTNYSQLELDTFIANTYKNSSFSLLYGEGYSFYLGQELYGANAIGSLAVALNESGNGRSKISTLKFNLFGHGAYDSSAVASSSGYPSVQRGIFNHAYSYVTYGYSFPSDARFFGGQLGNKNMGMNIKYSSDPYWGEKAAAFYYTIDSSLGMSDYNYYQIAIKSLAGEIMPASEPKIDSNYWIKTPGTGATYYNYNRVGASVIVVDEVEGDEVLGNTKWYKIVSDVNLDSNKNYIPKNVSDKSHYDWEVNYVYVPAAYFTKINQVEEAHLPTDVTDYNESKYTYKEFITNEVLTPSMAIIKETSTVYHSPSLENNPAITDIIHTVTKNRYVLVYGAAYDETGILKAYLIGSSVGHNYKEWIEPSKLIFVEGYYAKTEINSNHLTTSPSMSVNVRDTIGGSKIGQLYNSTYVVGLEQKLVNGVNWLKVQYDDLAKDSLQAGWVVQSDADQNFSLLYAPKANSVPEIEASDKTILINSEYNPLAWVVATDKEDGNITSKVTYQSNVDIKVAGEYSITYTVIDNNLEKVEKTIKVTVVGFTIRDGFTYFDSFNQKDKDVFTVSGFMATSRLDTNSNTKHYITFKNINTLEEVRFSVDNWITDVPFTMTNADDDRVYDYTYGWFKGDIDLSKLPQGDYEIYVDVETDVYTSRCYFTNIIYKEMTRLASGNNSRGYKVSINYFTKGYPMNISVRDEGLLASSKLPTDNNMYNNFETIDFNENYLDILGMSHSIGLDYSPALDIKREVILENVSTFERISYDVGSITNGSYVIELVVSDNLDKTRAWYNAHLDISSLEKGVYNIYVKTTSNDISDYGNLTDVAYTDFSSKTTVINNKTYTLRRVDEKGFRVELVVS